jgi:hypothetical protein
MEQAFDTEREEEKARAVETIEHALLSIEMDHGEPDSWQRESLAYAIGALFRGGYRLAETSGARAMVPMIERSSELGPCSDLPLDRCDLALLKSAFSSACAEPIRAYPQLGPTIFV